MFAISRRTLAALALGLGLATILSAPVPTSAADDKEVANALRAGGVIIVLRHGSTFRDQADTPPRAAPPAAVNPGELRSSIS